MAADYWQDLASLTKAIDHRLHPCATLPKICVGLLFLSPALPDGAKRYSYLGSPLSVSLLSWSAMVSTRNTVLKFSLSNNLVIDVVCIGKMKCSHTMFHIVMQSDQ